MTTFEPTPVTGGFICPCTDAYGEQAELIETFRNPTTTDKAPGGVVIRNFACDQNGDRWQLIEAPDGSATWHYIGRRRQ